MEINTLNATKTVELWLCHGEAEELHQALSAFYQQCRDHGYQVSVFLSGTKDLTQSASDLICYNRKRLAELETAATKRVG